MHAGNLHITPDGALYIVDWDDPSKAPRERDLMFIGGGQGYIQDKPEEEERLFYRGYKGAAIDPVAMAYYRYERTVMDISVEGERVLSDTLGATERAQSLLYFKWIWEPNFMIDRALAADQVLREGTK
jgi:spectinomycin phosphotransferase